MPVFLRFLMLLALVVWVGGITFFSVLAPNVFAVLPTRQLAGNVVNRMLPILHWMGLVSGVVFIASSMLYSRIMTGFARPLAGRHILVLLMLLLTLVSQFMIVPRMAALRADMANIDTIPQDDARRVEFNRLHVWSSRLEQGVFLLGLVTLFFVARRLH
jgi:uncharacterized membrane protein